MERLNRLCYLDYLVLTCSGTALVGAEPMYRVIEKEEMYVLTRDNEAVAYFEKQYGLKYLKMRVSELKTKGEKVQSYNLRDFVDALL